MYADKNDTLAEKNYAAKQEMPTYVKTFQAGTISDLEAMINAYAHKLNKKILSASITSNKDSSIPAIFQSVPKHERVCLSALPRRKRLHVFAGFQFQAFRPFSYNGQSLHVGIGLFGHIY